MTQGAVRGYLNGESRNRMAGGIAGCYFTSATTCCTNFSPAAGIPWAHLSRCRPQDLIQQQTAGHRGIERVEIVLHGNSYELITKRTLPRGEPASLLTYHQHYACAVMRSAEQYFACKRTTSQTRREFRPTLPPDRALSKC